MHIALFQILQICDIDAMRNRDKTMATIYDFILFILIYVLYADDNLSRGYLIHNFSNKNNHKISIRDKSQLYPLSFNSLKINVVLIFLHYLTTLFLMD